MKFVPVGIAIKTWPWAGVHTVDQEWEESDLGTELVVAKFGLRENEYQLLAVPSSEVLTAVCEFADAMDSIDVLLVELPMDYVAQCDRKFGYETSKNSLESAALICRGFDICDPRGFFSILNHPEFGRSSLFGGHELSQALSAVAAADVLDPAHAPFLPVRVSNLKVRGICEKA